MIMSNNAIFYYMSKLTTRLDVTSHNTLVTFADQTLASTELCHVTPHLPQPTSKLRLCPTLTLSLNSHLMPHVSCQVLMLHPITPMNHYSQVSSPSQIPVIIPTTFTTSEIPGNQVLCLNSLVISFQP